MTLQGEPESPTAGRGSIKHQDSYMGKRRKRGLFQSSAGKLINADVNGAIGILRKVVGDSGISQIINRGFADNPLRVNIDNDWHKCTRSKTNCQYDNMDYGGYGFVGSNQGMEVV